MIQNNISNDELNSKSKDKLSSMFSNSEAKSFVLNALDVADTFMDYNNKSASMESDVMMTNGMGNTVNSREFMKFDKSFTIHEEDDEEVLKEFDKDLKEIESNFDKKFNLNEEFPMNEDDTNNEIENEIEESKNLIQNVSTLSNKVFICHILRFFFK